MNGLILRINQSLPALRGRAGTSGGINTRSHIRSCSDLEAVHRQEESSEITFRIKKWIYLPSHLSTWLQRWSAELNFRCRVFMFHNFWLLTGERAEFSDRPESQTVKHIFWVSLSDSLQLMYVEVIWFFVANKHSNSENLFDVTQAQMMVGEVRFYSLQVSFLTRRKSHQRSSFLDILNQYSDVLYL